MKQKWNLDILAERIYICIYDNLDFFAEIGQKNRYLQTRAKLFFISQAVARCSRTLNQRTKSTKTFLK